MRGSGRGGRSRVGPSGVGMQRNDKRPAPNGSRSVRANRLGLAIAPSFRIHDLRIVSFNANGVRSAASKGFFDWFADAGRGRPVPAGNQGAGAPALRPRVPAGGLPAPGSATRRRRRATAAWRSTARREPDEVRTRPGLGAVRRRRALHRGALRQPERGVVLHPVGLVGRVAPGLQVRGDGVARADPRTTGCTAAATTCCAATGTSCAASSTSRTGSRTRRIPAACRASATGSTACAPTTTGWVDAYRALHAEGQDYTWWSNRGAARAKNVGWRIDYQFVHAVAARQAARRARSIRRRGSPTTRRFVVDYDL